MIPVSRIFCLFGQSLVSLESASGRMETLVARPFPIRASGMALALAHLRLAPGHADRAAGSRAQDAGISSHRYSGHIIDMHLHSYGEDEFRGGAFADQAREAGDDVSLEIVPGAGHHDLIAPWSDFWSAVSEILRGFLLGTW